MLAMPQSRERGIKVGLLPQRPLIKDVLCDISDTNQSAPLFSFADLSASEPSWIRHAKGLRSRPRLHRSAKLCTASASLSNVVI